MLDGGVIVQDGSGGGGGCSPGSVRSCYAHAFSPSEGEAFVVEAAVEIARAQQSSCGSDYVDDDHDDDHDDGALVEAIPVNYETGEPAAALLSCALRHGLHGVSANKGPVVHHRSALLALAASASASAPASTEAAASAGSNKQQRRPRRYLHESAVMDGVPVFNLAARCLPLARPSKLRGCLNSTTTVVLTHMEDHPGCSFAEALAVAQAMGIAETDPSGDVDGMDAAVKLTALVRTLGSGGGSGGGEVLLIPDAFEGRGAGAGKAVGGGAEAAEVEAAEAAGSLWWAEASQGARRGVRAITSEMVADAKRKGNQRWRLVATAELQQQLQLQGGEEGLSGRARAGVWRLRVQPELLDATDPLHGLTGASSALVLHTDALAPVTVVSSDPTTQDTAYGLLADLIEATSRLKD